jgi:hypothetical protein
VQRLGAAAHAPEPPGHMQRADIAPDGCLRGAGQFDQLTDGDHRAF